MQNPINLVKPIVAICLGLFGALLLSHITIPLWNALIHANILAIKASEGQVGKVVFTLIDFALGGFIILVLPVTLAAFLVEIAWSRFSR